MRYLKQQTNINNIVQYDYADSNLKINALINVLFYLELISPSSIVL